MNDVCVTASCRAYLDEMEMVPTLARSLRRADDFIRAAVLAAAQTLEGAETACGKSETGLFLSTAYGTMQTNFSVLDQIIDGEQTSPTLFSHSVFNAAAGYIAASFDIRGCALTLTDFTFPFLRAVQEGVLAIQSGLLSRCLVLHVETYSSLLHDLRSSGKNGAGEDSWRGGAVCWLLESGREKDGNMPFIERLELEDSEYAPRAILESCEELQAGESRYALTHPLALGMTLTDLLYGVPLREGLPAFAITAPWGAAKLHLSR